MPNSLMIHADYFKFLAGKLDAAVAAEPAAFEAEFRGMSESQIVASIEDGEAFTAVAERLGCARSTLTAWLNADADRSARVMRARQLAAAAWDELAESGIRAAMDPFELSRAKEMAHHYRWRSSKIGHREYGDKLDLNHSGRISTEREMTDDELGSIATAGRS